MTEASEPTLADTAALLGETFPGAGRVARTDYLEWLYAESPFGTVVRRDIVDDQGLAAHYAVVPVELDTGAVAVPAALSLNTAVHERARGGGVFVRLASETIEAARARGVRAVIGVANANSTPGFERRLNFVNLGPLPVTVALPTPGRRGALRSAWAESASALLDDVDDLLAPATSGWTRAWSGDRLRWRLRSPGARYAVHRSDELLGVSTAERGPGGAPVAVLLAAFAARPLEPAAGRALVRSACRIHRAPVALHAGHNPRVPLAGLPLPDRLRPSPLNLIARELDGVALPPVDRFEFLDFDAY